MPKNYDSKTVEKQVYIIEKRVLKGDKSKNNYEPPKLCCDRLDLSRAVHNSLTITMRSWEVPHL